MNIPALNYLVLSTLREQLLRDPAMACSLFELPVEQARQFSQVADDELRRICAATPTPVVRIDLANGWFNLLTTGSDRALNFDHLARYRAAVLDGHSHDL